MLSVSLDCFCFACLRLVYLMLSVSLDCFCFACLRLVYLMLSFSLYCFFFACLRLVYLMLSVSLNGQFVIAPSVFSNVCFEDCLNRKKMINIEYGAW
jgi:hypothetical protein